MNILPTPRERPWLSVAEVAAATGEGEKVIRAAIDAGQIPVLRIGRYVRIPTAAFLDLCGITPDMRNDEAPTSSSAETSHAGEANAKSNALHAV
jgi:excisionase family DNA binding protein